MPSRAEVLAMAKGLVGGIEGTEARLEDVYEPTVRSLVEAHPWNFAVRSVKLSSATEYGLVASDSTALTAVDRLDMVDGWLVFEPASSDLYARIETKGGLASLYDGLGRDVLSFWTEEIDAATGERTGAYTLGPLRSGIAMRVQPRLADARAGWIVPSDCLRVVLLDDGRGEYEVRDAAIYPRAGSEGAVNMTYIKDVTLEPGSWSAEFAEAAAYRIAAMCAYSLTESRTLASDLTDRAEMAFRRARSPDAQEGTPPPMINRSTLLPGRSFQQSRSGRRFDKLRGI